MKETIFCVLLAVCFSPCQLLAIRSSCATAPATRANFTSGPSGEISFTDTQGVQYEFPLRDVQSLVFSSTTDIVTLRNSKIYSGQYNGSDALSFQDQEGIQYQFPLKDVETLVLTQTSAPPVGPGTPAKIIPWGTEIVIRSDENIDSKDASTGNSFRQPLVRMFLMLPAASAFRAERPRSWYSGTLRAAERRTVRN